MADALSVTREGDTLVVRLPISQAPTAHRRSRSTAIRAVMQVSRSD